jgi:hypothetical protein
MENIKTLGEKITTLLNFMSSYPAKSSLGSVDEFRREIYGLVEFPLEISSSDWKMTLNKPDKELFSLLTKLLENQMNLITVIVKNISLIRLESTRSQIISTLQQNLGKVINVYVNTVINVMTLKPRNRDGLAGHFEKIFTALKQIWNNSIVLLKSYRPESPPDELTGIITAEEPAVVLNAFVEFLNSDKAASVTLEILCRGFSGVPDNYTDTVALWSQVFQALVTEVKSPDLNPGEIIFQCARIILFYRKVLLEPYSVSVKDWDTAASLLNQLSQQIVNLLVARYTDDDYAPKLAELVSTVKEIQKAL